MIDAFEAGLFLYWITPKEIVCVPAPSISITDNRLHRDDGPAVEWPSGERYWFWKGLRVEQWVIEEPAKITAKKIRSTTNAETRRVLIERFGYGRYMHAIGGELVHEDAVGKLWRTHRGDQMAAGRRMVSPKGESDTTDDLAVVEVINGTPEPNGECKTYHLSVPPTCRTATEAVAWTYGMTEDQYKQLQVRT